ncbi:MAG: hypothetical protein LUE87_12330 [Lachnospiraceae bacterium]|nr:hypothetical protein [Lachnospiraceae bacterium]
MAPDRIVPARLGKSDLPGLYRESGRMASDWMCREDWKRVICPDHAGEMEEERCLTGWTIC